MVMINDIGHLVLLAFITVITSVLPNGGSHFNGQDYMKGRDVYIESVAPN